MLTCEWKFQSSGPCQMISAWVTRERVHHCLHLQFKQPRGQKCDFICCQRVTAPTAASRRKTGKTPSKFDFMKVNETRIQMTVLKIPILMMCVKWRCMFIDTSLKAFSSNWCKVKLDQMRLLLIHRLSQCHRKPCKWCSSDLINTYPCCFRR